MSEKRFAYKVVDIRNGKPHTYKSVWAENELSKTYLPNETTHADADILEKGFGLFIFLDEEKAKAYAARVYVVWKVEIGTIMPIPEKILVGARYKSEYEHESEFREAYASENFNDWFMTDRVTLIEEIYDWRR
jgi:hypothetical protein